MKSRRSPVQKFPMLHDIPDRYLGIVDVLTPIRPPFLFPFGEVEFEIGRTEPIDA